MGYPILLLQAVICWTLAPVAESTTRANYTASPGRTRISLSCLLATVGQTCSWTGPKGQVLRTGDAPNPKFQYEVKNKEKFCLLAFTAIKFEDEGLWECTRQGDTTPTMIWNLFVYVKPKPPVLSYTNGTHIPNNVNFISQIPAELPLNCSSTKGRPAHDSVSLLINGVPVLHSSSATTGPTEELFDSSTSTSLLLTAEQPAANVTCVVQHATGNTTVTRLFGLKSSNNTILLEEEVSQTNPQTRKLRCLTYMFPWPSNFEIVKIQPEPKSKYTEREVNVTEFGNYMCRAKLDTGDWLESKTVEVKEVAVDVQTTSTEAAVVIQTTTTEIAVQTTSTEAAVEVQTTSTGPEHVGITSTTVAPTPLSSTAGSPIKMTTDTPKENPKNAQAANAKDAHWKPAYSIHYGNGDNSGQVLSANFLFTVSMVIARITLVKANVIS